MFPYCPVLKNIFIFSQNQKYTSFIYKYLQQKCGNTLQSIPVCDPKGQYLVKISAKVIGTVNRQRVRSDMAKVAMNVFLAVLISKNKHKILADATNFVYHIPLIFLVQGCPMSSQLIPPHSTAMPLLPEFWLNYWHTCAE